MCCGGVDGKLLLFDLSARLKIAESQRHQSEVIYIHFYEKQYQLVSVSRDKQINLWDANRLECVQIIKDTGFSGLNFTSACFSDALEKVFVVNRVAKAYKMKVNERVELQFLQT